ncbi:MAG: 50S ribosomal protein L10 [Candidatus Diapherotrites archaeon]|nr:50S ribosomal protein L10 [Candidatus Diapherotrites archaeon]
MTRHTRKWKEAQLEGLKKLINSHKVIAIAMAENMPARMLHELRAKLADKAQIRFSKVRVIKKALSESKFSGFPLDDHLKGQIAIIASNIDPFELYSLVKKNKIRTYLKVGEIADNDIVVPSGDTNLPPGPDLSMLKAANLPVAMQGSSIKILKDTVVLKRGQEATQEVVNALMKLDIKPHEIMLRISIACDGKTIYTAEALDIDLEKFLQDLQTCYSNAFALAYSICYVTPQNIGLLIQKAYREALSVAREGKIITKETLPEMLAKAHIGAQKVKALAKLD